MISPPKASEEIISFIKDMKLYGWMDGRMDGWMDGRRAMLIKRQGRILERSGDEQCQERRSLMTKRKG